MGRRKSDFEHISKRLPRPASLGANAILVGLLLQQIQTEWRNTGIPAFRLHRGNFHRITSHTLEIYWIIATKEYVNLCNKDVAPDVSNYVAKFGPYSEFLFGENYSE